MQARPVEGTLLTLDLLYAKLKATRQEDYPRSAVVQPHRQAQGGKPQTSVRETAYDAQRRACCTACTTVSTSGPSRAYDELSTTFTQPTLTLEQDFGETLKLSAKHRPCDIEVPQPGADDDHAGRAEHQRLRHRLPQQRPACPASPTASTRRRPAAR